MTERPQNLSSSRTSERANNSHRYQPMEAGTQGSATRAYRGSHRAERMHRAADSRGSRVGRHHHDQPRDHSRRW